MKWAIELSQFDIEFIPQLAIKGQAVASFITEFTTPTEKRPEEATTIPTTNIPK